MEAMNGLHSGRFQQPHFTALFNTRRWKALMPALALEGGLIQSSVHPTHQIQVHLQAIIIISLEVNRINKSSASNT